MIILQMAMVILMVICFMTDLSLTIIGFKDKQYRLIIKGGCPKSQDSLFFIWTGIGEIFQKRNSQGLKKTF